MGGTVTVVIRRPDGTVHCMHRWTNPTPYYITNMRVVNDDMGFIDEYVYRDREIDPDDAIFAPRGYGIIVVDMKNKVIIDMQGYLGIGKVSTIAAIPSSDSRINDDWKDEYDRIEAFVDAGRIVDFRPYSEKLAMIDFGSLKTTKDIMDAIKNEKLIGALHVDMSPYKIERYHPERSEDVSAMLRRVKELGFTLSDDDILQWNECIDQD